MLRSGVVRLHRGAAAAASHVSESSSAAAASSCRRISHATQSRRCRKSVSTQARLGWHHFSSSFHSDSYFNSSTLDFLPEQSGKAVSDGRSDSQQLERFIPPLFDIDLIAQNDVQQALFVAIRSLDADLSWHLYKQLGKARLSLPPPVIDFIITLQCRKPVRSSTGDPLDKRTAVRQVCDRVLLLCQDRARCEVGSSASNSSPTSDYGLTNLSAPSSLRLLYLLVVEEEQVAAARTSRPPPRRKHLSSMLDILLSNVNAHVEFAQQHMDIQLRGRIAASLSRLGSTDAAFHQLSLLVELASQSADDSFIDPRPFDQLLIALAKNQAVASSRPKYLPSPVDFIPPAVDEKSPILKALKLTLHSQVGVSKANIHRCLQSLDTATLWWLLPFELDGTPANLPRQLPDDRHALKPKWHPWQNARESTFISRVFSDSFAERIALVLAQRGILQPALHIFDCLQIPATEKSKHGGSPAKIPDHDIFTVVVEQLAARMAANNVDDARMSLDMHRGLSSDLHLLARVYTIAHDVGVDLDSRLNEAVVKAFASCLPSAIVDLGPHRARFTKVKAQIAQRNQHRGSREALRVYLRRFTVMVLRKDPDLSEGSLNFASQATLLGLHARTRDYSFSRRLYQLIRLREPGRELWSADESSESLLRSTLDPLAGPDRDAFMWLFASSLGSDSKPFFAVRLYLDWLASGNTVPSRLIAIFVQALLRSGLTSSVQRVLQELQERRVFLPARLARSLVVSFAEAGFPDLAVEIASVFSQDAATTAAFRPAGTGVETSPSRSDSRRLGSTLNLISIALDRSSKTLSANDDDLRRKIYRLFDDFRLGLTHFFFGEMTSEQQDGSERQRSSCQVSSTDIRMAYNAIMRAQMSAIVDGGDILASADRQDTGAAWSLTESTCSYIEALFHELRDLGVHPDSDSWSLRLTSCLYACFQDPSLEKKKERLQDSIRWFEEATKRTCNANRPMQGDQQVSIASSSNVFAYSKRDVQTVRVHPAIVAALIDASRDCNDLTSGLRVYELYMRRNGVNSQVEKARLKLLAALAEPEERILSSTANCLKEDPPSSMTSLS